MAAKKKASKKPAKKKTAAKKPAAKKTAKRKAPAKKPARKTTAPKKKKSSGAKRKPNPAFMKPMMPDATLAAVVGDSAMPRTEITKRVWAYVKKNGLQDSSNKRMINADDKLRGVFGGRRQVSMFEMTKLVNEHLS